ncbi:hypothetical protein BJ508DRAFT_330703 [Ascobolus immersus RN42]|uniref:Uncharacterized protein n=1 Tax=Ascobolus immersus RN42 TaxID=1160509 RepID=A0A3N4HYK6_ASCIM|nr:hypothetical protein BJ508DRAFT_330703 [Ascobolus immersus RN42]
MAPRPPKKETPSGSGPSRRHNAARPLPRAEFEFGSMNPLLRPDIGTVVTTCTSNNALSKDKHSLFKKKKPSEPKPEKPEKPEKEKKDKRSAASQGIDEINAMQAAVEALSNLDSKRGGVNKAEASGCVVC